MALPGSSSARSTSTGAPRITADTCSIHYTNYKIGVAAWVSTSIRLRLWLSALRERKAGGHVAVARRVTIHQCCLPAAPTPLEALAELFRITIYLFRTAW